MDKVIPDPPFNTADPFSEAYIAEELLKDRAAAQRALDYYLSPAPEPKPKKSSTMFIIAPDVDNESLLVHACETLASINVMASNHAFDLEGAQRSTALAIQQMVSLAELAVNRALDNVELTA
jgi:hypothetical protein